MSAFANLSISRKLMAAFAAVLAVIFASSAVVYERLSVIEQAKEWRVHTDEVLEALQSTLDAILDQETGVRGYLITGEEGALEPYHAGRDALAAAFRKLEDLASGDPVQQRRLDELKALSDRWGSEIAERAIALMATPDTRDAARALQGSMAGKTAMDVVRAKVDGIATIERGLLATRVAVQNQAFATAYVMTILGGAASLAVATLMGVLLTRKIAAPIARMTRVMASLAEGDTGVVVPRIERNDDIGAMAAAVEVFKDSIIERQSTQAELARREAKIRRLVDANIIGVFFYALEGGITEANDAFLDLVGYDRTDLAAGGLRWTDLTPSECFERDVQERVPELKRTGILVPFEKEYVRKDGSRVPVLIGAATLGDGGEQGVAFVLDLTGRKRAEILTAQVFDHAPDGICIVERNYRYRRANPVYARRWGMPAERIAGMHVSELLGADVFEHVLKANLDRCFAGEEVAFEWLARAQDGLYLSVSYSPLRSGAHEVEAALVIQRDLTEYMRANERLRASQADLAHVTRMSTLGELAASIVHEVNQPLAGIAASADAGLRWLERQSPDLLAARRSLVRVRQEADRAVAVIGRIRALARKSPIRMDRLDINAVVQDVIALMRSELDRNRIRLRTRLAPDLPAVQGDRIHLQQVILNLMVNAIEAMQDTDHRELLISSAPGDADDLRVAIYDWGPGLDTDNYDRIFASFYTTKPHGMGMGLSISRSIIEAHGGRLTAAANKPHGAIFQFTVPLPSSAS